MMRRMTIAPLVAVITAWAMVPAQAQNVVADWTRIKAPPAPSLHHVAIDPHTSALLLLDFVSQTCNATSRPRCVASIPGVARLLAQARAHHAMIIYSDVHGGSAADIAPALKRRPGEPVVQSGPDKFLHTDLAGLLRMHGIKTVIVTGTAAEGAVLSTASEAAFRGYRIVVPVDAMSSAGLYAEQYVAWDLLHSPGTQGRVTLTTTAQIGFR